eukprot:2982309-Prymnesium_polylepis.1
MSCGLVVQPTQYHAVTLLVAAYAAQLVRLLDNVVLLVELGDLAQRVVAVTLIAWRRRAAVRLLVG